MQNRKMSIIVGAFVLSISLMLIGSIIYVIDKKGLLEDDFTFFLVSKSGEGISQGMPVIFSGFEIGRVKELDLTDSGEVVSTIVVPVSKAKWLRIDSTFTLDKPLIGSPKILIESKNLSSALLKPEAKMHFSVKDGINQILEQAKQVVADLNPVVNDLQAIVSNVKLITDDLADDNSSLNKTLANVEDFSGQLVADDSVINTITGKSNTADQVSDILDSVNDSVKNLAVLVRSVDTTVLKAREQVLSDDNSSIAHINNILTDIEQKLKRLDSSVDNVNNSTEGLEQMKDELRFMLQKK